MRWAVLLGLMLCAVLAAAAQAQDPLTRVGELIAREQYDSARVLLAAAGRQTHHRASFYRGRLAMHDRNYELAERELTAAVRAQSQSAEYSYWLGLALHERMDRAGMPGKVGLLRRAKRQFEETLRLDPDHVDARAWVALYLWKMPGIIGGSRTEALRHVEEVTRRDATRGYGLLGSFRWEEKRYAECAAAYRALVEQDPTSAQAWYMLGRCLDEQGAGVEAMTYYARALQVDSVHVRAALYFGRAAAIGGASLEEAERHLEGLVGRASPASSTAADAHAVLGLIAERRGDVQQARERFEAALRANREQRDARDGLRRLRAPT